MSLTVYHNTQLESEGKEKVRTFKERFGHWLIRRNHFRHYYLSCEWVVLVILIEM